jgi:hypothetical protein
MLLLHIENNICPIKLLQTIRAIIFLGDILYHLICSVLPMGKKEGHFCPSHPRLPTLLGFG